MELPAAAAWESPAASSDAGAVVADCSVAGCGATEVPEKASSIAELYMLCVASTTANAMTFITTPATDQNNGNSQASFNPYDWKAEDAQGAQRSQAFYTDGENELNSGTLAAGGSVSGNLYFEGDVVKVLYENVFIGRGSDVSWNIA